MRDRQLQTCTDCPDFTSCETIQNWYKKNGHKYRRYGESAEFIREHGYDRFVEIAAGWKDAYGRLT